MSRSRYALLFLLLAFAALSEAGLREGCAPILFEEPSGNQPDHDLVCDGADRAVRFFAQHDVAIQRTIHLKLHDRVPAGRGIHIGTYDASDDRVDLLSLARARRLCERISPFGMAMDEELYTSFVAHEVAHAIAEQNFAEGRSSPLAHEYLGYVVQLATMDADTRMEILRRYEMPAFGAMDELSLVYYHLDPHAFGVKAYRHFRRLADPVGFIRGLLSGRVRLGSGPDEPW